MIIQVFQVDPVDSLMPYDLERETIGPAGGELVIGQCQTEADVIAQAGSAEVLLVSWTKIVSRAVMEALPHCRLIVRWGIGYDMIDVQAATDQGIAVANAPAYATDNVAEFTTALVLNSLFRVTWFHEKMRAGDWPAPTRFATHRLTSQTLGLVGLGRIGRGVAARARALGLRVVGYDAYLTPDQIRAQQIEPRTLADLLAEADVISLHIPLNAETRHLLDEARLGLVKPGAFLINTSRGGVIEETALIKALKSNRLGGAALDVFEAEPLAADHPLRSLENVTLTPHIAHYSAESWLGLRQEVCQAVTDWIRTDWSPQIVNPQVRANRRPRRS